MQDYNKSLQLSNSYLKPFIVNKYILLYEYNEYTRILLLQLTLN